MCRRDLQSAVSQRVPIRECPALHFWKPMAVHRTCRKRAPRALQGRFRNRGCTGRIFLATNAGMPAWRMRTSFCQGLSARCRCARLPHRLLKQIVICRKILRRTLPRRAFRGAPRRACPHPGQRRRLYFPIATHQMEHASSDFYILQNFNKL